MDSTKIIEIYNDILSNYISKVSKPAETSYENERKKYKYILEKLYRFYYFTSYISDQKISAKGTDRILFPIYSKCSLDLLGIFHCLNNGLEVQACVIFRSLFESYINIELMLRENPSERIKLFC